MSALLSPRKRRRAVKVIVGSATGVLLILLVILTMAIKIASAPVSILSGLFGGASACPTATGTSAPVSLTSAASSELTIGQQVFAVDLARASGLNALVIAAWELQEENGAAAALRQTSHNDDWLNIGYTDSGTFGAADEIWRNPGAAAIATYGWLKGDPIQGYPGADTNIQAILNTAGQPAALQIAAIQGSGWATSGEPALPGIYAHLAATSGNGPTTAGTLNELTGSLSYATYQRYLAQVCGATTGGPLTLTPGQQAKLLPNGNAAAPSSAPKAVQRAIAAANEIDDTPYIWGGGHSAPLSQLQAGYDCSGSTSFALYAAGLMPSDIGEVSGWFENYGSAGPGKWITIYANSGHVFMQIARLMYNTAWYDPNTRPTAPSTGPRWQLGSYVSSQIAGDSDGGFVVRHPTGL